MIKTDVTRQYPELHDVPTQPGCSVILDGEVARMDDSGWIDFEAVMERFRLTKAAKIREASLTKPVHYYVFDIGVLAHKINDSSSTNKQA